MKDQLEKIKAQAMQALESVSDLKLLDELRIKYLGKKGELTAVLRGMGALSPEERPKIGALANQVREQIEEKLQSKIDELSAKLQSEKLKAEEIDVTIPGRRREIGKLHPLSTVLNQVKDIFIGMGFSIAEGPDVELDYYNFEALNIPKNHPARDTQDTFYIDDNVLLRTQTSSVQVRVMEQTKPPIRVIAPGRVYRSDEVDATHSPLFHQVEGLVVDKGITMGDLKGTLEVFAKALYGDGRKSASARTTSRSQSRAQRWTCRALCATARGAMSARGKAGLRFSARVWCTRRCWLTAASTRRFTAGLRSGWGWSVSRCAVMTSTICACSLTTTCGS